MPSKNIQRNVEVLKGLTRGAKEDVKYRVDKVVEFIETGRFHKEKPHRN